MEREYRPDENPYAELLKRVRTGRSTVLATVVATEGSSPQVAGASALFSAGGLACGTVGGGTVEAAITALALKATESGISRLTKFDLSDESFEDADGICGGEMTILIDARPDRHAGAIEELVSSVRRRRPGTLATFFEAGRSGRIDSLIRRWIPAGLGAAGIPPAVFPGFAAALAEVRAENRPGWYTDGTRRLYLEPHTPRPRLIVAGAGHVGRAVAHLGAFLGFEVVVVDDRPEFANRGRFPDAARIIVADPAKYLRTLPLTRADHVVIVTRGHLRDEDALKACIRRRPAYLGMIGSRRKIEMMRERFLRSGDATEMQWARVRAPIGLPIGSRTVEEIAVSVAAELVRVRRGAE